MIISNYDVSMERLMNLQTMLQLEDYEVLRENLHTIDEDQLLKGAVYETHQAIRAEIAEIDRALKESYLIVGIENATDWQYSSTTFTVAKRIYCKDCRHFDFRVNDCVYTKYEERQNPITGLIHEVVVDNALKQLMKIVKDKKKAEKIIDDLLIHTYFNKENDCHLFEEKEVKKQGFFARLFS